MSKYDNLELAMKRIFIKIGFSNEEATKHTLDIWREWDRLNEEEKNLNPKTVQEWEQSLNAR